MRWYWILLMCTLLALLTVSPDALVGVQRLMPSNARAAIPLVLVSLAVLATFAALVLSSRNFGLLAVVFGLGTTLLQQGYLHALASQLGAAARGSDLQLSLIVPSVLHGAGRTLPNDAPWLLPLTLCALLMAGVLMAGPKAE